MPLVGYEPAFPASERPQTQALDRAATGIGGCRHKGREILFISFKIKPICHLGRQRKTTGVHSSKKHDFVSVGIKPNRMNQTTHFCVAFILRVNGSSTSTNSYIIMEFNNFQNSVLHYSIRNCKVEYEKIS